MQIIERKFQNTLKKIFTSVPILQFFLQFCIKKEKNKQTKYNTADQVVEIQAVNFVIMKNN